MIRIPVLALISLLWFHGVNATSYLRATALVTLPANISGLQCWQFDTPYTEVSQPGIAGALGLNVSHANVIGSAVLPPGFDGGLHRAPEKQLVVFLTGLAVISLPSGAAEAYIVPGSNGLIVAADTEGTGHYTRYPSNEQTFSLTMPFKNGKVPRHTVVNATGPCVDAIQVVAST